MNLDDGPCPLCTEHVSAEDDPRLVGTPEGMRLAHRECLLRSVMGGIGHLTDHSYWCTVMHDPDGGMSYRDSALAVDHWVHVHGPGPGAGKGQ